MFNLFILTCCVLSSGMTGPPGNPGHIGLKGEKGDKGHSVQGYPGFPGIKGQFCNSLKNTQGSILEKSHCFVLCQEQRVFQELQVDQVLVLRDERGLLDLQEYQDLR